MAAKILQDIASEYIGPPVTATTGKKLKFTNITNSDPPTDNTKKKDKNEMSFEAVSGKEH